MGASCCASRRRSRYDDEYDDDDDDDDALDSVAPAAKGGDSTAQTSEAGGGGGSSRERGEARRRRRSTQSDRRRVSCRVAQLPQRRVAPGKRTSIAHPSDHQQNRRGSSNTDNTTTTTTNRRGRRRKTAQRAAGVDVGNTDRSDSSDDGAIGGATVSASTNGTAATRRGGGRRGGDQDSDELWSVSSGERSGARLPAIPRTDSVATQLIIVGRGAGSSAAASTSEDEEEEEEEEEEGDSDREEQNSRQACRSADAKCSSSTSISPVASSAASGAGAAHLQPPPMTARAASGPQARHYPRVPELEERMTSPLVPPPPPAPGTSRGESGASAQAAAAGAAASSSWSPSRSASHSPLSPAPERWTTPPAAAESGTGIVPVILPKPANGAASPAAYLDAQRKPSAGHGGRRHVIATPLSAATTTAVRPHPQLRIVNPCGTPNSDMGRSDGDEGGAEQRDDEEEDDFDLASDVGSTLATPQMACTTSSGRGEIMEHSLDDDDDGGAADGDVVSEVLEFVGYIKGGATGGGNGNSGSAASPPQLLCGVCFKRPPVLDAAFCCFCGQPLSQAPQSLSGGAGGGGGGGSGSASWASPECDTRRSYSVYSERSVSSPSQGRRPKVFTRRVRVSRRRENILGRGTSGVVYRCFDYVTGAPLAVKEIRADLDDKLVVSKMKQELRYLSRLQHPNVVRYFGCNVQRAPVPRVSILTERLECGSLQQMLDSVNGGLSEEAVKRFSRQLVMAIAYCHASSVTHRDVKPANLLLTSDGNVKLTDFGSAFDVLAADVRQLEVAGTAAYMPPEALDVMKHRERSAEYFRAHDIWSIGATAHQLLTGVIPWSHTKLPPFALVMHIAKERTFPLSAIASPRMIRFLELCLEPDMQTRATAEQLLQCGLFSDDAFQSSGNDSEPTTPGSVRSEHLSASFSSSLRPQRFSASGSVVGPAAAPQLRASAGGGGSNNDPRDLSASAVRLGSNASSFSTAVAPAAAREDGMGSSRRVSANPLSAPSMSPGSSLGSAPPPVARVVASAPGGAASAGSASAAGGGPHRRPSYSSMHERAPPQTDYWGGERIRRCGTSTVGVMSGTSPLGAGPEAPKRRGGVVGGTAQ